MINQECVCHSLSWQASGAREKPRVHPKNTQPKRGDAATREVPHSNTSNKAKSNRKISRRNRFATGNFISVKATREGWKSGILQAGLGHHRSSGNVYSSETRTLQTFKNLFKGIKTSRNNFSEKGSPPFPSPLPRECLNPSNSSYH